MDFRMDFKVSINLPIIKREHPNPSYIKLLNGRLFQETNVEGSICATIHFECLVGHDTIEHQVALVFVHINHIYFWLELQRPSTNFCLPYNSL